MTGRMHERKSATNKRRIFPPSLKKTHYNIRQQRHQYVRYTSMSTRPGQQEQNSIVDDRRGDGPLDLVSFLRPRFSNRLSPARACLFFFLKKKKSLFSFFPRVPPRTRTRQHPRKTPLELEREATARPPKRACATIEAIRSSWHVSTRTYMQLGTKATLKVPKRPCTSVAVGWGFRRPGYSRDAREVYFPLSTPQQQQTWGSLTKDQLT